MNGLEPGNQKISLPRENVSQEIGKRAVRALKANMPVNWTEAELSGDSDFGLDFLIQIKDESDQICANFYLQLKGTESPSYVNDGKEISHQFNSTTLNYYRRSEPAVMVAVVDLSFSEKAKDCPIYYKWLDEDYLDEISKERELNEKISIRLDINDLIDETLNVLPFYQRRLEVRESLIKFRRKINRNSTETISAIDSLAAIVEKKPVVLSLLKDEIGSPWINNPDDHTAGKLKLISDAISENRFDDANRSIQQIDSDCSDHEKAELLYQMARIRALAGDEHEAAVHYKRAYEAFEGSRYKVAYLESHFSNDENVDQDFIRESVDDLSEEIFSECAVKAKFLAVLGRQEEALRILDQHPMERSLTTKLLVFTITGDYGKFDEICSEINLDELNERQRFHYHILAARRHFHRGVGSDLSEVITIPLKGRREYDFQALKMAFQNVEKALEYSKKKGFPYDLYVFLGEAKFLYCFFNCEDVLIRFLEEIHQLRPKSLPVIEALITLRFSVGKYSDVIDLINILKDRSPQYTILLILCYYHLGKKAKVIKLMDEYKDEIIELKPENYKEIFCIAAQCAEDNLDEPKESEFLSIVKTFDNGDELYEIYVYLKSLKENPQKIKELNIAMHAAYLRMGNSFAIAKHLLPNLDIEDVSEAVVACDLARTIWTERELTDDEYLIYAFSLSRIERWQELLDICVDFEKKRELSNVWILLKASAFDNLGRSKEALEILEDSVNSDLRSFEKADNYVDLCIRLGFLDCGRLKSKTLRSAFEPRLIKFLCCADVIVSATPEVATKLTADCGMRSIQAASDLTHADTEMAPVFNEGPFASIEM